ncbi:HAD family hydrolase [Nocardia sp. NPDC003999]
MSVTSRSTVALLVDAGGVLFNNVTEESRFIEILAARWKMGQQDLLVALDSLDAAYETDSEDVIDVLRKIVCAAGGRSLTDGDARWLEETYGEQVTSIAPAFEALAAIRVDHPTVSLVLANNEARRWDMVKNARFGHFALFDRIASSWAVGLVKPEPEYFKAVGRMIGMPLSSTILVDDNPDVLAEAGALGMRTVRVIDRVWPKHELDEAIATVQNIESTR